MNRDEIRRPGITKILGRLMAEQPDKTRDFLLPQAKIIYSNKTGIRPDGPDGFVEVPNPEYQGGAR